MNRAFYGRLPAAGLLVLSAGCGTPQDEPARTSLASADPDVARLLVRAQTAFETGDYGAARALAEQAVQKAPELPHAYFLHGRVLTVLHHYDRAQRSYERALALDSAFKGARFNLGNNAYRQGRYREAIRLYEEEQRLRPSPDILLHMARAYAELHQFDAAYAAYQEVLAVGGDSAAVYAELGQLYEDEGNLSEALHHSRRALALEPGHVRYRYALGLQALQAGHLQEAIGALEAVVAQEPWNAGAHHNLGQALLRLGRPEEAELYLSRVDSLQRQSRHLFQLGQNAALAPDQPAPWIELGNAYRRAGQLQQALETYRIAQPLMPQNLTLQNNIANLAHLLGHTQEAIARYEAILRQDSTVVSVWVNLGVARTETGQEDAAREAWQSALHYDPGNPLIQRYLASLDAL